MKLCRHKRTLSLSCAWKNKFPALYILGAGPQFSGVCLIIFGLCWLAGHMKVKPKAADWAKQGEPHEKVKSNQRQSGWDLIVPARRHRKSGSNLPQHVHASETCKQQTSISNKQNSNQPIMNALVALSGQHASLVPAATGKPG